MIKNIFGKTGENVWVEAPFHCDYGWNIEVGENFYSNYNLTILDEMCIRDRAKTAAGYSGTETKGSDSTSGTEKTSGDADW